MRPITLLFACWRYIGIHLLFQSIADEQKRWHRELDPLTALSSVLLHAGSSRLCRARHDCHHSNVGSEVARPSSITTGNIARRMGTYRAEPRMNVAVREDVLREEPTQLDRKADSESQSLPVRIDGVWYDCAAWADKHPGGRWLLDYARGRDVTALYRATHMLGERKTSAALKKLPKMDVKYLQLPSRTGLSPSVLEQEAALQGPYVVELNASHSSPIPPIDTPLRQDLQAMLQRRFPTRESTKATPSHWIRTIVAGGLCASCWGGWFNFDPVSIVLLPLAQWVLAAHTVHEATHGALSTNPRVNFWMQFTSHPILFNVFVWIPQHLLSHHQYTNDPQHDVDVHHFAPARLAATQSPYVGADKDSTFNEGWTFVWKGCLTTVGTCLLQPLRTLLEKDTPNFDANLTPIPAAVSKRTLLLSMLPSVFVLLYPLIALASGAAVAVPLPVVLLAEIWPWVGMSIIWTLMTQTSHVQAVCQPTHDLASSEPDCWTARQIGTALDYSVGNALATALTAGLNNQGMHHAMPAISMAHFPAMYSEYEEICRRHGVEPRQSRDLLSATQEMLDYIFELNRPASSATTKDESSDMVKPLRHVFKKFWS